MFTRTFDSAPTCRHPAPDNAGLTIIYFTQQPERAYNSLAMIQKEYITPLDYEANGEKKTAYRIAGTRVSLDSVVYAWRQGESPEGIVDCYPSLTLEQVHGALACYLANQEEIDEYLRQGEVEFERLRQQGWEEIRQNKPLLYQKLMAHKQQALEAAS